MPYTLDYRMDFSKSDAKKDIKSAYQHFCTIPFPDSHLHPVLDELHGVLIIEDMGIVANVHKIICGENVALEVPKPLYDLLNRAQKECSYDFGEDVYSFEIYIADLQRLVDEVDDLRKYL